MKPSAIVTYGVIATLIAGFHANAEVAGAESNIPKNAEMSDAEKAAQLARLQAQAGAAKSRKLWMDQWKKAKDLQVAEKGERRMGSPRAVGRRAKEKEALAEIAKKRAEWQIKALENYIFNSMQSSLWNKEKLDADELKWLESLAAQPEDKDAPPVTDEGTRRRAKLIMDMTKEGWKPPVVTKRRKHRPDKPHPDKHRPDKHRPDKWSDKPAPDKPAPIQVE